MTQENNKVTTHVLSLKITISGLMTAVYGIWYI